MILHVLSQIRGNVGHIRKASKLLDIFELSEEEREEIGLTISENGYAWTRHDVVYKMVVEDRELQGFFTMAIANFEDWPVRNLEEVEDLLDQLQAN
jgi:hypothetical protein